MTRLRDASGHGGDLQGTTSPASNWLMGFMVDQRHPVDIRGPLRACEAVLSLAKHRHL